MRYNDLDMGTEISMTIVRQARTDDLPAIHDVFYQNEIAGVSDPPPPGKVPPGLYHLAQSGVLYVAELDGEILAFAGAIARGHVSFLTDLFVRPDRQSGRLGTALLRHVLPAGNGIRCTVSSTDPRAQALYIRAGMQPQWPHYCLRLSAPLPDTLPHPAVEVVEADPGDPEIERWDARIGGRARPADHAFWVRDQRGVPLWFRRQGVALGYGYLRPGADDLWNRGACTIGPLGVAAPEDATACVLAAVRRAAEEAETLLINLPGPHPSLAPLLEARFRITYVETFVSSAREPFFDARCYLASDSSIF